MPIYYYTYDRRRHWGTATLTPSLYTINGYTTASSTTTSDLGYYFYVGDRPVPVIEYVNRIDNIPPIPEPPPEAPAIITARERALTLLLDHLTPAQRFQYETVHSFDVEVNGRRYRISSGWSGNVKRLNESGGWIESLCIHFDRSMPIPDLMLAQKLMLETNEAEFRRIANISLLH